MARFLMHNGPCPYCAAESPGLVQALRRIAFVNYYLCPECQQVWAVTKDGSGRILDDVTNLPVALSDEIRLIRSILAARMKDTPSRI